MVVVVTVVGSVIGAASALTILILGHSIWMALLIYLSVGVLSVLGAATALALRVDAATTLRADSEEWAESASTSPYHG
jgi:hypothetical protein